MENNTHDLAHNNIEVYTVVVLLIDKNTVTVNMELVVCESQCFHMLSRVYELTVWTKCS